MPNLPRLRSTLPWLLLALPAAAAAASLPARNEPTVAASASDEKLEESMETMNSSLRQLRKGISAETRERSLGHVDQFQRALLDAKLCVPPTAKGVDEAKRPEFVAGYRAQLARVLAVTGELEVAILEGRYADAKRIADEELPRLKDEGHERYAPEDEDEK